LARDIFAVIITADITNMMAACFVYADQGVRAANRTFLHSKNHKTRVAGKEDYGDAFSFR